MGIDVNARRDEAARMVERGKFARAVELYRELEENEPNAPSWPKRIGETYRRAGNSVAAVAAFERAVDKYVAADLPVQAVAVCKLILALEPRHSAISARMRELAKYNTTMPISPILTGIIPIMPSAAPPEMGLTMPLPRISELKPLPPPPAVEHNRRAIADFEIPELEQPDDVPVDPIKPPTVTRIEPAKEAPPRAVMVRIARRSNPTTPVRLRQGDALDALDLSAIVPGTQRLTKADGTEAGISVLSLEDLEFIDEAGDGLDAASIRFEIEDESIEIPIDDATDVVRRALAETPLFSRLPAAVLEQLVGELELVELQAGDVLFREGEHGSSLFVVSDGEVSVEAGGKALAALGPGTFFGEISLLTDLPRSATIRAIGRVELLAIDRDAVRRAAAVSPDIVTVLLGFVRDRLVDRVVQTSELFRPFEATARASLAARFELVEVATGTPLLIRGEAADGIYVVVGGKVEVRRPGKSEPVATLASGDMFGVESVTTGVPATADVIAVSRSLALRMPVSVVHLHILTHPEVRAYLDGVVERRAARDLAEELVDDHLNLL
jgi:CRP-like cAMP-binding protein